MCNTLVMERVTSMGAKEGKGLVNHGPQSAPKLLGAFFQAFFQRQQRNEVSTTIIDESCFAENFHRRTRGVSSDCQCPAPMLGLFSLFFQVFSVLSSFFLVDVLVSKGAWISLDTLLCYI